MSEEKPNIRGKPATWWHCEDVRLSLSEKRLAAWTRAVILTGSKFGDYYAFGYHPRDSWCASVLVMDQFKDKFEEIAGVKLTKPLIVNCNTHSRKVEGGE